MNEDLYGALSAQIQNEFDCASDYIWKAPRLIEHETKLELTKLDVYFPKHPDLAERRWRHESAKLKDTFPYMIAVGNLLTAASLYETYLLHIARILDKNVNKLDTCSGRGASRIHSFFRLIKVNYSGLSTYSPVEAAVSIRNCLIHCSGLLEWSRDQSKLRDLISKGRYLSPAHRTRRLQLGSGFDEVQIVQSYLGERIYIDNLYAHVACCYFRDHLLLLAEEAFTSPVNGDES